MPSVRITGPGPTQLKALAVALKDADPALKRALRRRMKDATAKAVTDVRASALGMPAEKFHQGLREQIAATVGSQVSVTARGIRCDIVSNGRKMPPGKQSLPYYTDQPGGWNHPVFARGQRFHLAPSRARKYRHLPSALRPQVYRGSWEWSHQFGEPGWFERPIGAAARNVQDACQAAMDEVKHRLEV